MEEDHESLQRVAPTQGEMKFDLAGETKRVEQLRRELRDLRSRTDVLAEGKAVRLLSEEVKKQKSEMRKQRDEMNKLCEDMRLQSVEVQQSMQIVKTPVEHRHPSREEKADFRKRNTTEKKGP